MKRNLFGGLFACVLTAAALVGAAGTAEASWACGGGCEGSYWRKVGTGRYEFKVRDSNGRDGYAARAYIATTSGRLLETQTATGGYGDHVTFTRSYSANYVKVEFCTVSGATKKNCTGFTTVG
jgi:hypothetical protein